MSALELKITFLLLFTGLGAYVGLAAVASFRKANTTVNPLTPESISSLVVSGIFRRTRNPMYLALHSMHTKSRFEDGFSHLDSPVTFFRVEHL